MLDKQAYGQANNQPQGAFAGTGYATNSIVGGQQLNRSVEVREPEIRAQFERLLHAVANLNNTAKSLTNRLQDGGVLRIPVPSATGYGEAKEANALQSEFGQRIAGLVTVVDDISASLRHTENILEI